MPAPKSPIPDIGTASLRKTNRQVAYERALCINKSNFGKLSIYRLSPILEKKWRLSVTSNVRYFQKMKKVNNSRKH